MKQFNDMIEKAHAKLVADEALKKNIEILAKKLYETRMPADLYKEIMGYDKPAWRVDGLPWDKYPDLEIAEHERDDYRCQATLLLRDPDLNITFLP